jgi:hypothetical protein
VYHSYECQFESLLTTIKRYRRELSPSSYHAKKSAQFSIYYMFFRSGKPALITQTFHQKNPLRLRLIYANPLLFCAKKSYDNDGKQF